MNKIIKTAIDSARKLVELAGGLGLESETLRPRESTASPRR